MTRRQRYQKNLKTIANLGGDYYRQLSFYEAAKLLRIYRTYRRDGLDKDTALQYAWDHIYVERRYGRRIGGMV